MIISLPVQIAVCASLAIGELVVLVAVQVSVTGLYLPPVFKSLPFRPPQIIISRPVHTALCDIRAVGPLLVATQESVVGLYLPPVLRTPPALVPPQTIISVPFQTAV